MERESLNFDVVIIGAGPAGLAAAIRLAQLSHSKNQPLCICVLEKGAQIGAHVLSGAVMDPIGLTELIPDWKNLGAPLHTPAIRDEFLYLTKNKSWRLPTPSPMKNRGNYIISLDHLCRWLATYAESLGVQIFPGFSAVDIIYDNSGKVLGVTTGDKGVDKTGQMTAQYQPGINLFARQTLLAEGCRGSLTQQLIQRFDLDKNTQHQTYGIGIKELWEIPAKQHQPGLVLHSVGWPLDARTYGGSFLYHLENQRVAVGFVVGLDYSNPFLDPFEEFQRFKTHPVIRNTFAQGQRIGYGARALNEGGWQSIPQLGFPGGLLVGDCAGFLNVPRIKGIHTSMKSGILAAEALFADWDSDSPKLNRYEDAIKASWLGSELYRARNIRPAFKGGLWKGLAYAALDTYLFKGNAPWTFKHSKPDYACLKQAAESQPIAYPKPDGVLTFDKLTSVYISNTHHEENQPCHLQLADPQLVIDINFKLYDSPETRYCPAGVYEILNRGTNPELQINAANCLHCKTCDIKDPKQNIRWVPPEGGDGPNYSDM